MVTVAVLSILATVAFPSFTDFIDRRRLANQTEAIIDFIQMARSEAVRHSGVAGTRSIAMTVTPNGSAWSLGLANGEAACGGSGPACAINQGGTAVPAVLTASECGSCTITAPTAQQVIVFSFRGLVESNAGAGNDRTIDVASPKGYKTRITISKIGRVSTCSVSGVVGGYAAC
jgi:Tfp pilus assembly protein FimT